MLTEKTAYLGCYRGCPIEYLPTGYIVWSINNEKMKPLWYDFYRILGARTDALAEPELPHDLFEQTWWEELDEVHRRRFASMMTDGRWAWTADTRKGRQQLEQLQAVFNKLGALYGPYNEL